MDGQIKEKSNASSVLTVEVGSKVDPSLFLLVRASPYCDPWIHPFRLTSPAGHLRPGGAGLGAGGGQATVK